MFISLPFRLKLASDTFSFLHFFLGYSWCQRFSTGKKLVNECLIFQFSSQLWRFYTLREMNLYFLALVLEFCRSGPRFTKGYNNKCMININRSSMANRVLRILATNHNPLWNQAQMFNSDTSSIIFPRVFTISYSLCPYMTRLLQVNM